MGADLTLTKAVQICQTYEYAHEQLKTMTSSSTTGASMGAATAAVNYVDKGQGSSQGTKFEDAKPKGPHRGYISNPTKGKPAETDQRQCGNCGKNMQKACALLRVNSAFRVRYGTISKNSVDPKM